MAEVLVINTALAEDQNFNDELTDAVDGFGYKTVVISYLEAPDNIERINDSRTVIVTGVPFHYPYETAEKVQPYLRPWLPELKVPLLGICLGHQAMGLVFGATMRRNLEVEHGLCTAEITPENEDPIFTGLGKRFKVPSYHWASISIADAPKLTRLAYSLAEQGISMGCENQVVRVDDQPCYGAQFHPEKSDVGKLFLRNFLELPNSSTN